MSRKKGSKDKKPRKRRCAPPLSMRSRYLCDTTPEQLERWQDQVEERRVNAEHAAFKERVYREVKELEEQLGKEERPPGLTPQRTEAVQTS